MHRCILCAAMEFLPKSLSCRAEDQLFRACQPISSWCRSEVGKSLDQLQTIPKIFRKGFNRRDLTISICKSQPEKVSATGTGPNSSYTTLDNQVRHTLEVKRSKFMAVAAPVADEDAALAFLSQVRDPSASHNCWAFQIGERSRFSDDGEPGGTAGRPMHTALNSSGLDHVMVVVTRYYGGTKLGTGGLVRAYGRVTSECLKDAPTVIFKAKVPMTLRAPFDVLGVLYPLGFLEDICKTQINGLFGGKSYYRRRPLTKLQAYDVEKVREKFDSYGDGGVCMDLLVDLDKAQLVEREVIVTCRGRASLTHVDSGAILQEP